MRIWNFIKSYWRTFNRPATHLSLGLLSMGGFIAGIIFSTGPDQCATAPRFPA